MALHNVVDKVLQRSPIPPNSSERERLNSPAAPFARVCQCERTTPQRSAAIPEPVFSGRWNHGDPLIAQRRIQIHVPNSFQKLLLQKPFLYPNECGVIILHRDHHGGLADDPVPDAFWHCPQPYAQPTNDHEQQPAGGKLVPASQHTFENLKHIPFSNRRAAGVYSRANVPAPNLCRGTSDRVLVLCH